MAGLYLHVPGGGLLVLLFLGTSFVYALLSDCLAYTWPVLFPNLLVVFHRQAEC